ncbi:MAG TPA: hypothetical protein VII28_02600 [Puia sp.]
MHIKEYVLGAGGTMVMSNDREKEVRRRKKKMFLSRVKENFRY